MKQQPTGFNPEWLGGLSDFELASKLSSAAADVKEHAHDAAALRERLKAAEESESRAKRDFDSFWREIQRRAVKP